MQDYYDIGAGPLIDLDSTRGLWLSVMSSLMYLKGHPDTYYDKRYGKCTCKICDTCKMKVLSLDEREVHKKVVEEKMGILVERDRKAIFNI